MTRVVRFHQTGGPEVLQIDNIDIGSPGPGEVRVRIQSIGLNRAEAAFRAGTYLEKPVFPSLIGYEAAGTVEALGDEKTGFKVGDPVCILPSFSMTRYGVYAESAIVPGAALIKWPTELSAIEAAAVWMPYLTALGAMRDYASFGKEDAILITAASSSVGLAAIQIVNRLGAVSVAVTRSAAKRDALLAAGARHVIVSEEENIAERTAAITQGKGARMVLDAVAGPGVTDLMAALGPLGTLVIYGNLSGRARETPFPYLSAMQKGLSMRAYLIFQDMADSKKRAAGCDFVLSGIKDKSLKPTIAKTFTLDQIADAHRYLESSQQIGKIVVTVPK